MLGWESNPSPALGLQSLPPQGHPRGCLSSPKLAQTLLDPERHHRAENLAAGLQDAFSSMSDTSCPPPSRAQPLQHQTFSPAKRRPLEDKQDT